MAYLGNQPVLGNWRKLDDISGSFNGATTSFTTSVAGENVTAATVNQLFISLDGVIQEPGVDFTVTTNTIQFTTAPASGLSFFGIYAGDSLNLAGVADGAVATASLQDGAVTPVKVDFLTLANYADDAAAASGGVAVGDLYRNGSVVQIRVS